MSAWSDAVVATSPYLYYRLGEGSGTTAADSSGNSRTGTAANVTWGQASLVPSDAADTAILIDNANDQVSPTAAVSYSSIDFSAMVAMKGSTNTGGGIFASGSSNRLDLGATNVSVLIDSGSVSLTPSYPVANLYDGNEHLVILVVKTTSVELWVDGTMVASNTHARPGSTRTTFQLKRGSNNPSAGTWDELTLWDRGLTSTEIGDLFDAFSGAIPSADAPASGSGTTTVTARPVGVAAAPATGAGTTVVTTVPVGITGAPASGAGTTSVSAYVEGEAVPVDVNASGEGTTTVVGSPVGVVAAPASGSGATAVTAMPVLPVAIAASGSGTTTVEASLPAPPVGTDVSNTAELRSRGGWGVVLWEPDVVPRPLTAGAAAAQDIYAVAYGAPTMAGTMPTYSMSEARKAKWRQQILIGGRDVTFERGVETPDVEFQLADPLLYSTATVTLPQISGTREWGKPWLSWLRKRSRVRVNLVDSDDVVQATVYRGFIFGPNLSGPGLTLKVGGEAHGRASLRDVQPPVFRDVLDLKRIMWRRFADMGLPFPRLGGDGIGIRSLNWGGTGMLEFIEECLARMTKRDGTMRTVMPDEDGMYDVVDKDLETVHWTVFLDEAVSVGDLNSDIAEEPLRIYATGVAPSGMRWNGAVVPGLVQGPTPAYPMAGGAHMMLGTTNEDTIDGDGVSVLINRLGAVGLLDIRDTPGGFDADVEDAIYRLRRKAGLANGFLDLLGVMTPNLWDALWDLDVTGFDRRWASIQPMAQHDSVRRYDRSGSGAVRGLNDTYDEDMIPVDLSVDMGSGFTADQGERWADALVWDPDTDSWYGTITLRGGALLIGQVNEGATITPEMMADARLAKPCENLWVPNFNGGTLFHIAVIDVGGEVRLTVDTRGKPARDVWERIRIRKETRRNPIRGWLGARQSTQQKDAVQGFIGWGGCINQDVELVAGHNVIPVVVGDYGTIAEIRTTVQRITGEGEEIVIEGAEHAVAVFGKEVSAGTLNEVWPTPLAENGDRPWRRGAAKKFLNSRWDLYSAGTFEEPCGYGEDIKTDDATLTGLHIDRGGFPYKAADGCVVYLTVYVEESATLLAGRIMWPLLEGGV